jgi:hypothetical protein
MRMVLSGLLPTLLLTLFAFVSQCGAQTIEGGLTAGLRSAAGYQESRLGGYGRLEYLSRWGAVADFAVERAPKQDGAHLGAVGEIQIRRRFSERGIYALGGLHFAHNTGFGGKTSASPIVGFGRSTALYDFAGVYELPDFASENHVSAGRIDVARRFPFKNGLFGIVRASAGVEHFDSPHPYNLNRIVTSGMFAQIRIGVGR